MVSFFYLLNWVTYSASIWLGGSLGIHHVFSERHIPTVTNLGMHVLKPLPKSTHEYI